MAEGLLQIPTPTEAETAAVRGLVQTTSDYRHHPSPRAWLVFYHGMRHTPPGACTDRAWANVLKSPKQPPSLSHLWR